MGIAVRRFRFIRDPQPALAGASPEEFLANLGGPACLFFEGRDKSRTRAFVTLLHGNEPSGFFALRRWLLSGASPAGNLLCIEYEQAMLELFPEIATMRAKYPSSEPTAFWMQVGAS